MKAFTSAAPPATQQIEFELQWWTVPTDGSEPQPGTEKFSVRRYVPPGLVIDLARSVTLNARGDRIFAIAAIGASLEAALEPESWERMNALLHDGKRSVAAETLGELIMWLNEELTGRPTGQPST